MTGQPTREHALVLVEEGSRQHIVRFLEAEGFEVDVPDTVTDAMARLVDGGVALALVDISVAGEGADLVRKALEADPDLAVVVLSDVSDATTAAICLQHGAFDYITKPVRLEDLRLSIDRALRKRGTLLQQDEISAWLKQELVKRTQELERERQKLEQVNVATLGALINALEAKDPDFLGHSQRVSELAATIADEMGMSDDDVEAVRAAGRLHDIGKIGIRDAVLRKKGPLTNEEYEHVKQQVVIGFRILSPLTHLGAVTEYVHCHHEHWDGTGYPRGLKGEEIPTGARIVCAAEIYDAITTSRPYQDTLEAEEAIVQMRRLAGTKLDPAVVSALSRAVARHKTLVFVDSSDPTVGSLGAEEVGGGGETPEK